MPVTSSGSILRFKNGSMYFIPLSVIFLLFAVLIPFYIYPGYFLENFLNFLPYPLIIIVVLVYDITRYRKMATIEVWENKIVIASRKGTTTVLYKNIESIAHDDRVSNKLLIIKTRNNLEIGIFDRPIRKKGSTVHNFILSRIR
jgi:hypothetical protein